jgi:hypothetical protein
MTVEEFIEQLKQFPLHYTVVFDVIGDDDTECQFKCEQGILTIILDFEPNNPIDYESEELHDSGIDDCEPKS